MGRDYLMPLELALINLKLTLIEMQQKHDGLKKEKHV